ncbi:hypothetical protein E5288_WYG001154 [Bos mutus]|uniref:Uncharacterized protein n=1 Tax=Bos mutus TaxID=72004 RepID=A0A6B0RYR6_9CETA|nr:hypothetical protein [Bos mutus]
MAACDVSVFWMNNSSTRSPPSRPADPTIEHFLAAVPNVTLEKSHWGFEDGSGIGVWAVLGLKGLCDENKGHLEPLGAADARSGADAKPDADPCSSRLVSRAPCPLSWPPHLHSAVGAPAGGRAGRTERCSEQELGCAAETSQEARRFTWTSPGEFGEHTGSVTEGLIQRGTVREEAQETSPGAAQHGDFRSTSS